MAGWGGFSEDELRKMQGREQVVPAALGRGRKPPATNRSRQQLQRERALQVAAQQRTGAGTSVSSLPPEQQLTRPPPQLTRPPPQLTRPPPQAARPPAATAATPVTKQVVVVEVVEVEKTKEEKPIVHHEPAPVEDSTPPPPISKELEKPEVEIREKTRLEQLQQDQKMMEDNNKLKKALLTKTIAEKSKQTQAEAVKLRRIQKELQALDDMVSNDIGILRGRIEEASWDYNSARKRYEKAETEYVAAKLDLHRKTEVKEQLTEHLCAIIQQNELRKAHKLEELMLQLSLHASEEELERGREEEERERLRKEEERERLRKEKEEEEKDRRRKQEEAEKERQRKEEEEKDRRRKQEEAEKEKEKQRKEEEDKDRRRMEEEEKRRSVGETPGEGKEEKKEEGKEEKKEEGKEEKKEEEKGEKGIQENGEAAVQSGPDEELKAGGETERQRGEEEEADGASSHQDCPPVTEPKRGAQDCERTGGSMQSPAEPLPSPS